MFAVHVGNTMATSPEAGKLSIISGIGVTVATGIPTIAMLPGINGKVGSVMIKVGTLPFGCRVTGLAVGWEAGTHMIWIGGIVVIRQMTTGIRACPGGGRRIIAVSVTNRAVLLQMGAVQGKTGLGFRVIEGRRRPGASRMTLFTGIGETGVGRILGTGLGSGMARHAGCHIGMIPNRGVPGDGRVALGTILGRPNLIAVHRFNRSGIGRGMAVSAETIMRNARPLIVKVTQIAVGVGVVVMLTHQRKTRELLAMVKVYR